MFEIKVNNGKFVINKVCDPDYPGVYIEFVADNESENALSRPGVLVDQAINENNKVRALIWNNPNNEDYGEEIVLYEGGNK